MSYLLIKSCTKVFGLMACLVFSFFKLKQSSACSLDLVAATCRYLNSNKFVEYLYGYSKNPHRLGFREFTLFRLSRKIRFIPEISSNIDNLAGSIASDNIPAIVLSTHSGFSFATRSISARKKNVTVIANRVNSNGLKNTFRASGINHEVNVVANDKYCLAKIKELLATNATVICCVDFKPAGASTWNAISPNLFNSISLFKVPVYFHKDQILVNGHVNVNYMQADEFAKPEQLVHDFIAYINQGRARAKNFDIVKFR